MKRLFFSLSGGLVACGVGLLIWMGVVYAFAVGDEWEAVHPEFALGVGVLVGMAAGCIDRGQWRDVLCVLAPVLTGLTAIAAEDPAVQIIASREAYEHVYLDPTVRAELALNAAEWGVSEADYSREMYDRLRKILADEMPVFTNSDLAWFAAGCALSAIVFLAFSRSEISLSKSRHRSLLRRFGRRHAPLDH
jgi:hypothetical protein